MNKRRYLRDDNEYTFAKNISRRIKKEVKELLNIASELEELKDLSNEDVIYELNNLSDYLDSSISRLYDINSDVNSKLIN